MVISLLNEAGVTLSELSLSSEKVYSGAWSKQASANGVYILRIEQNMNSPSSALLMI